MQTATEGQSPPAINSEPPETEEFARRTGRAVQMAIGEPTGPVACHQSSDAEPDTFVRNHATGEMIKAAAEPASVRVKISALSKLKAAAAP